MRIVTLFGPPAVGKLTVARALARRTGYRLFDNHRIVDAALALYDFGTPGFVALREALWRAAFAEMLRRREPEGVIFTFAPERTVSQRFIDELFTSFATESVDAPCVALTAAPAAIEARLAAPDRHQTGKLVDLNLYLRLRDAGAFDRPRLPHPGLTIDTTNQNAEDSARTIAAWLDAPR